MENNNIEQPVKSSKSAAGVFIPAGIFIGMGIGFIFDNLAAGLFIGMGAGFAVFAVTSLIKK